MSWLPLGVTGLSPATVNAGPALSVGRAEAADPVGLAETVGLGESAWPRRSW